jgi:hypothetical protein
VKKNYLPSKKFTYSVLAVIVLAVLSFVVSNIFSQKSYFSASSANGNNKLQTTSLTINDLLQKSSAGDGIPDWEKALWGLDPNSKTTDGIPDAEYIQEKREKLETANGDNKGQNNTTPTETDKFAQQFFASLTAMQQSGQVDANTINNVSTALGQNIVNSTLTDKYTTQDVKIEKENGQNILAEQKAYYLSIKGMFQDYKEKGVGNEIQIIGILTNPANAALDNSQYVNELTQIAGYYQEYATKIMELSVPQSLVSYHLEIANSANNTGVAVANMAKVISDPIVGMSGLSQYQEYSNELISSVGNLENILYNNGVIVNNGN